MGKPEHGVPEMTNFERLAAVLPKTGIAQELLAAWRAGDVESRVARLIKVVQPTTSKADSNDAAPED
jgi:hypothetical protein